MYLNQFHKEATERKIKGIAESKQSPMNSADTASHMKHNLELLTQKIAKDKFKYIPAQNFKESWTDKKLYKKYDSSEEEINFIESMIKPME
jgi:hypothetical protein